MEAPKAAAEYSKPSEVQNAALPQASPAVTELKPLGYVDRPGGSRQTIISKGGQVFLVREGETFNDHYRVLKISPSTVEVADISPSAKGESAPSALPEPALVSRQTDAPKLPLDSSQPRSTFRRVTRMAAKNFAAKEPITLSSSRAGSKLPKPSPKELKPASKEAPIPAAESLGYVERAGRLVENIVALGDEIRLISEKTLVAEISEISNVGTSLVREVSYRPPPFGSVSSRTVMSAQQPPILTFKPFCYVERANGSREAFIDFRGRAYLVQEGEVFRNRYRVLKVSPLSVEVADVPRQEDKSSPIPLQDFAETRVKLPEAVRWKNPAVPEALPLKDIVRGLVAKTANGSDKVLKSFDAARNAANAQAEPTLPKTGSSTLGVSLAASVKPQNRTNEPLSLSSPGLKGSVREAVRRVESLPPPVRSEAVNEVKILAPISTPFGITPLPLQVTQELIQIPGQGPVNRLAQSLLDASQSRIQKTEERSLPHPSTEHQVGLAVESSSHSGAEPGMANFQPATFNGLLLRFSIGDNTCYPPRITATGG